MMPTQADYFSFYDKLFSDVGGPLAQFYQGWKQQLMATNPNEPFGSQFPREQPKPITPPNVTQPLSFMPNLNQQSQFSMIQPDTGGNVGVMGMGITGQGAFGDLGSFGTGYGQTY